MQPGLASTNCFMRKPTANLALEVRSSSSLLEGVASCKAHRSQLHRWVGGAQVVHVRMRTSRCIHLVVSSLCCSWCIMRLVVQMCRMVRPCCMVASRDIVRLLPSRAGGERRERGFQVIRKDPASRGTEISCAFVTDFDLSRTRHEHATHRALVPFTSLPPAPLPVERR